MLKESMVKMELMLKELYFAVLSLFKSCPSGLCAHAVNSLIC